MNWDCLEGVVYAAKAKYDGVNLENGKPTKNGVRLEGLTALCCPPEHRYTQHTPCPTLSWMPSYLLSTGLFAFRSGRRSWTCSGFIVLLPRVAQEVSTTLVSEPLQNISNAYHGTNEGLDEPSRSSEVKIGGFKGKRKLCGRPPLLVTSLSLHTGSTLTCCEFGYSLLCSVSVGSSIGQD